MGMYPSEFEAAETTFTRVDEPLFLGLPPLLALMLFLLILAVAAGMFFLGRWHADQTGDTDADRAPEEIHRAILNASLAAMGASSNDLKSHAEALRATVRDLLGSVILVGTEVSRPLKDLDEALKGEIKEAAKDHGGDHGGHGGHDHGRKAGCTCATPQACICVPASVTINQVYLSGAPLATPGGCGCSGAHKPGCDQGKPAHPPEEHKPETRAMTGPEQIDALSKAVRRFHDHWSHGPARIRELRDARRALSRRPPSSTLRTADGRVWNRS